LLVPVLRAEEKVLPKLSDDDLKKIEAAVPAKATAAPKQARKILVFWRCEGFFHGQGIAGGNYAIEKIGEKTGAWTTDVTADYAALEPASLAKYDAVVLNNTTHIKIPNDAAKQGFLDFVAKGKGLIGIHAATDNFNDWPEASKLIGGKFAGHPWGGGGTWSFKLDEPGHSLLKAFNGQGFKLKDEIYQFKDNYTRDDRRVLITMDLSDPKTLEPIGPDAKTGKPRGCREDNDYAVSWIKNAGQGRVFYCSLGHGHNVFQDPAVMQYYADGIQFALGDLAADASPKK
jgi:type 1 glutamine amidotransferase